MKRFALLALILLLLTSCQPTPPGITPLGTTESTYSPSMTSFDFGDSCPHVCWLGINPGTTTVAEAKAILRNSNQIDKQNYTESNDGIDAVWRLNNFNSPCQIHVWFGNGLVESLEILGVDNTLGDFVQLLGKPDQIQISVVRGLYDWIHYAVYFSPRKVRIEVDPAGSNGPEPSDTSLGVWLNVGLNTSPYPFDWGTGQPWLGYGHIKDYLPGIEIPVVPPTLGPNDVY